MLNLVSGSTGIVSIISISLLLIFVIGETLQGLRRGWKKQLLHTVATLEAAVISFVIVKATTTAMLNAISAENVGELLSSLGTGINAEAAEYISSIKWLVALPVTTLIAPFAFVSFFVFAVIFSGIMYNVTKRLIEISGKPGSMRERLIGMLIGAVEGLIVCSILMLPLAGTFGLFDDGVNAVRKNSSKETSEFIDFYDKNLEPVANNVAFKTARAIGGDALLASLATLEDGESKINLRDEIVPVVSIAVQVSSLDSNAKSIDDDDKETLNKVIDTLESSDYLTLLIAQTLNGMAYAVKDGIVPLEMEPPFDKLMNSVISLFETSTKNNVVKDIRSLTDVYYILCDDGVLLAIWYGDSDALVDIFITRDDSGDTVVNKVIAKLKENEHTEPLVSTLTELSVVLISSSLDIGDDSAEIYEDVKDGLRDVLTIKPTDYPDTEEGHESYIQDMTASLDDTFRNNGIELEPEVTRGIAEYIDTEMEIKDEYTDADLDSIILSYYDAYLDYLESGEIPDDLKDKIPGTGGDTDEGEGSDDEDAPNIDDIPSIDDIPNIDEGGEGVDGGNADNNGLVTYTVYVVNSKWQPIQGVSVCLVDFTNDKKKTEYITTDENGMAVFTLEEGHWAAMLLYSAQKYYFNNKNVANAIWR